MFDHSTDPAVKAGESGPGHMPADPPGVRHLSPPAVKLASASEIIERAKRCGRADWRNTQPYLDRVDLFEDRLQAFAVYEKGRVLADLARADGGGRLAGALVAIKDVIDTADYPTEFFSPIHRGRRPIADAWVVSRLRAEGAIIAGKTHTTEFGYAHTGPTRNPHDPQRTPGSSSAGSAAGVAAGFFPLALGTQTAGSVLKPASYCGVFAFKPTYGRVPTVGILPHAPSFDTVGWFARSAPDLKLLADVLIPGIGAVSIGRGNLVGWCETPYPIADEVAMALSAARHELREAGWSINRFDLPDELSVTAEHHVTVNEAEAVRSISRELEHHSDAVSQEMRHLAERAGSRGVVGERLARERLLMARPQMRRIFEQHRFVLAPTCGIVAPLGLESTGPSDHIRLWTAYGLPQVSIPLPVETGRMPIGLQVIGAAGDDWHLLRFAKRISATLGIGSVQPVDPRHHTPNADKR